MTNALPLRHTWFQNSDTVEVNVMVKRRRADQVTVELAEADDAGAPSSCLHVLVHDERCASPASTCTCEAGPATCSLQLWGGVAPAGLHVELLGSKVEIKLTKSCPGEAWPTLEKADVGKKTENDAAKKAAKNWDKIGDEDDDEDAGRDPMGFFQHLFAGADDDTRRAMMKSYVESNGTSLSTNWDEVKSKDFSKE